MTGSRLRAAFMAAAATWALLIVAATYAASRPHVSSLGSALIIGVYVIGSAVCHQLPERSFHLWGAQMPVCARCAGIYFGAAAGVLVASLRTAEAVPHTGPGTVTGTPAIASAASVARGFGMRQGFSVAQGSSVAQGFSPAWRVRLALALAVLPSLLTLVYEWSTGVAPAHAIRAAAGIPIGAVVAWLVVAATNNQVN